jgi:hypothetical protein
MKINITNVPAITAALAVVNGRAVSHTARAADLVRAAHEAETQLISLGFKLNQRKGATVSYRSGTKVSKGYGGQRVVTVAKLVRGSSTWFVVELGTSNVWPEAWVGTFVTLSPQQDQIAVARFRTFYGVSSV